MSIGLNEFMNGIGIGEKINVPRSTGNSGKSMQDKVIKSINDEIKVLQSRENLEILKKPKKVYGEMTEVNENRFWKPSPTNPNQVVFNIKVNKRIFGFGQKVDRYNPTYFSCENNKDVLIEKLVSIKEGLEKLEPNHKFFQTPSNELENSRTK